MSAIFFAIHRMYCKREIVFYGKDLLYFILQNEVLSKFIYSKSHAIEGADSVIFCKLK